MKCCCESKGTVRSGIRGILACFLRERSRSLVIERCDACERFDSDEAAAIFFATLRGGAIRYNKRQNRTRIVWSPR
jgi:hypothetical protein